MRKYLKITLLFAIMFLLVFPSIAIAANLQPSAWSSSGLGSPTIVSISDGGIKFSYNIFDSAMWDGETWTFHSTATANETFTYNWNYIWFHAWYMASARVTAFANGPDGQQTVVIYNSGGGGATNGTSTLNLHAGYTYGFIIWGSNYDWNPFGQGNLEIRSEAISASIDVKPGDVNDINLSKKGVLPVAILTNENLDATQVNPATVNIEGISSVKWALEDVDVDGDQDMILHFLVQDLATSLAGKTELSLGGATMGGKPIIGSDTINIVPAK